MDGDTTTEIFVAEITKDRRNLAKAALIFALLATVAWVGALVLSSLGLFILSVLALGLQFFFVHMTLQFDNILTHYTRKPFVLNPELAHDAD